jgi:hypothetical protein
MKSRQKVRKESLRGRDKKGEKGRKTEKGRRQYMK